MSKGKKGSSKKKYFIGIVVVCIIVLGVAAGFYFLRDNNTNNKKNPDEDKVISLSNDETSEIAMFYDSRNQKDVMYNPIIVEGMITYSMDYDCESPNGDSMILRKYLSDQGMAVLMNGYPYNSPKDIGVNTNDEAYMATQMAVWEILNRTGESHKSGSAFRVDQVESLGDDQAYERVISAAKRLVKLAEDEPYTSVPTMVIDNANVKLHDFDEEEALIGPYTVTMEGTSDSSIKSIKAVLINAPESAKITDKNGNIKTFLQSGDSIYVKINKSEDTKNFDIRFESFVDRATGVIYEEKDKNTQDYLRLETTLTNMKKNLTIEWEKTSTLGKITLNCVDEDGNPVVGATFELLDDEENSLGEIKTGTDGKVSFYSVPVGSYTLREKEAPEGYKIAKKTKNLTVEPNETTKVKFVNSKEK